MNTKDNNSRELVRNKYGLIASGESNCCGKRTAASTYAEIGKSYASVDGYVPEADLGLGCGVPTEFAEIERGSRVLDLGSGAGNDAFIARREVGETGHVIGLDFTPEMIAKAELNCSKLGYQNVEFRHGEIENIPIEDKSIDVVISNCVLNLIPDKNKAFTEIYRVLKPGGHFCVSDIVLVGLLPEKLQSAAEFYVGCIAGAMQKDLYLKSIEDRGFENVEILKERTVHIPDKDILEYLTTEELADFHSSRIQILSITVKAKRPLDADNK